MEIPTSITLRRACLQMRPQYGCAARSWSRGRSQCQHVLGQGHHHPQQWTIPSRVDKIEMARRGPTGGRESQTTSTVRDCVCPRVHTHTCLCLQVCLIGRVSVHTHVHEGVMRALHVCMVDSGVMLG